MKAAYDDILYISRDTSRGSEGHESDNYTIGLGQHGIVTDAMSRDDLLRICDFMTDYAAKLRGKEIHNGQQ